MSDRRDTVVRGAVGLGIAAVGAGLTGLPLMPVLFVVAVALAAAAALPDFDWHGDEVRSLARELLLAMLAGLGVSILIAIFVVRI